jgi:2,3-diaminopropionate biosynthesis protein SbnB
MFSFDVVPGKIVKGVLDSSALAVVDLVEDAYLRHDDGKTVNPDSYFLRFPDRPDSRIIALPAAAELAGAEVAGIKWIASFPGNVAAGLPRASAVLVLNDLATGYPIALLEAAGISAARTAASAAVAARAIARHLPPSGTVGIVGAGVIARTILRFLHLTGYPCADVVVHDLDDASAGRLVDFATAELGVRARRGDLDAVLDSQTVVTATTALRPYIDRPLRDGQLALNVSLRDFTPEVVLGATNVLDDVEHCLKANTSPHLAEQLTGNRDFVHGTIAQFVRGERVPEQGRGVLVSPFGLGVLDLAVGAYVLDVARRDGTAIAIPEFFGETSRW